ncbi:MAG: ankyrin repeat domain-containing protein, partial [Planctomycetota bacterium]
ALLDAGADPNAGKEVPLWEAIDDGDARAVKILLDHGARPDGLRVKEGRTPLHEAVARAYRDIAEALLEAGADVTKKDANGRTPRELAEFTEQDGMASLILSYEKRGAVQVGPGEGE